MKHFISSMILGFLLVGIVVLALRLSLDWDVRRAEYVIERVDICGNQTPEGDNNERTED